MSSILELVAVPSALRERLAAQLDEVSLIFERQLASDLSAVNTLCRHVERYRGKMLRPTAVLLSGYAVAGERAERAAVGERHAVLAAVVEMIHMATLVHDDVLDEAPMRRRGATVNELWGNEAAVMLGDYLISNAFHLCSTLGDPQINIALGRVTNTLCEGELVQLHHREQYGLDEATYFEIVRRKTASLIAEACRLGAALAGADDDVAGALHGYGEALGVAFQIQDDLLDLTGEAGVVGKSLGKDLDKGKLTLPVIRHLVDADQAERGRTLALLAARDGAGLRAALTASHAVARSVETARRFVSDAVARLDAVPDGPAKALLMQMAHAVVERRH